MSEEYKVSFGKIGKMDPKEEYYLYGFILHNGMDDGLEQYLQKKVKKIGNATGVDCFIRDCDLSGSFQKADEGKISDATFPVIVFSRNRKLNGEKVTFSQRDIKPGNSMSYDEFYGTIFGAASYVARNNGSVNDIRNRVYAEIGDQLRDRFLEDIIHFGEYIKNFANIGQAANGINDLLKPKK